MFKFFILLIIFIFSFNSEDEINITYSNNIIIKDDFTWVKKETIKQNNYIIANMSRYGPDCYGCSGYLAYKGINVKNNIYFKDKEYGLVRIVAADKSIPYGTIIKVNNDFLVIVLDRGGAISFDKKYSFDLLCESEDIANTRGVFINSKFEYLRYGF